jgi:soluble epoxide hydrolase/lipid-phosphate phosphatase
MEGVIVGDKGKVEKFLNGMYGGRTSSRRKFMVPEKGVDLDVLENDEVGKTPFFEEDVSTYYALGVTLSFGLILLTYVSRRN